MSKLSLSARHITWILVVIIVMMIAGIAYGNYELKNRLADQVTTTNNLKAEAMKSDENLSKAKTLELYMQTHKADVERAAALVAQAKTYQYQNQIINDVTSYANSVGIDILSFDFPDMTQAKQTVPGLNSITVTINLRNPVEYTKLLRFLKLIEQNLTKMQITSINFSPDAEATGMVTSQSIGLEVYVK
ncbi:MAG: hypothetical protein ACM3MA_03150 [Acidobacteriota bacterium]